MALLSRIKTKLAQCETVNHERKCRQMIERNYKVFNSLVARTMASTNEMQKIKLAEKLARWAATNHSGIFANPQIEAFLCNIASSHPCLLSGAEKKNSVLHVLTTGCKTGGHTRVVEKWVKYRPEDTTHDVAFIDQKIEDAPEFLYKTLKDESMKEIHLKGNTALEKALELRKLASNYEQVVLHTHMYDTVPILAFGTNDFHRPVIYYNHADHIFWLGVSIADVIVDLTHEGARFSHTRRGVKNTTVLPVPISAKQFQKQQNKQAARKKLNLPTNKKIMLSIGGSWRFAPVGEFNFPKYCTELLAQNPELMVIIVGVDPTDRHWKRATKKFGSERLNLIGRIFDKTQYEHHIEAADFYVEALPAGAEITTLEVGLHGVPVYILNQPAIRAEVFNALYAQSYPELKAMVNDFLQKGVTPKAQKAFQKQVMRVHSEEAFKANIAHIHKNTPNGHNVTTNFEAPYVITNYDIYLYNVTKGLHKQRGLVGSVHKLRKWKRKLLKLF